MSKKSKTRARESAMPWWEKEARHILAASGPTYEAAKRWQAGTGLPIRTCILEVRALRP